MSRIEFEDDVFSVDATLIAQSFGIAPQSVQPLMREGRITSLCERGVDEDAGRHRLTFFHGRRRLRLVVDETGNVIDLSVDRSARRAPRADPPASKRTEIAPVPDPDQGGSPAHRFRLDWCGNENIMTERRRPDWNPDSEEVLKDQVAAYDELRRRGPIAYSDQLHWSVLRHKDAMRMLTESATFSNTVSAHLSVPNGMDPPEHTEYRRVIEPYFAPERMAALEPKCRAIAVDLVSRLPADGEIELMAACAESFALQSQCAFLDWPANLHGPLREWVRKNHRATRSRDKGAMAAVALEFDTHIRAVLVERRGISADAGTDVATRLLREQVHGRPLSDEEVVSILRNWTVGELATISASVGILARYVAEHRALQQGLREQPSLLPAAIDEILRIHPPLIASRRITTRAVELGGRRLEAGERLTLLWASANRDEAVFRDPNEFRLDRDPSANLLYGAGIHVCPGAPLARMELRVWMEELLGRTREIAPGAQPSRASYPASGFSALPLKILK